MTIAITANRIGRILFPLLLLILPLASAEAFAPSPSPSRNIHHRKLRASKPNSQPAFVSSTASENETDAMAAAKKKKSEYSWTKPTLDLAVPALLASIAGEIFLAVVVLPHLMCGVNNVLWYFICDA